MGDYQRIAETIARIIDEHRHEEGISPNEIPEIAGSIDQGEINCYPGIPGFRCCDLALFVSLSSPAYIKTRRGHLSCRQAIEKVVQHMQGSCFQKTTVAVLVTDSWDATAYDEWMANLQRIRSSSHIEIYLMSGPTVSEIRI